VKFIGISRVGFDLFDDARDGRLVECSEVVGARLSAPCLYCMASPFLQRRVVQERVRLGVQDLVSERRRLWCVARDEPQISLVDPLQDPPKPFEIHCLFEAIPNGLTDERVVGYLAIAWNVLETRGGVGEDGREQIRGEHPLDLRRELASAS
jgi:hypothetical protein